VALPPLQGRFGHSAVRGAAMISVTLSREELLAHSPCAEGLQLFDAFRGDYLCIHVGKWTILNQLWFSVAYPSFYAWGRDKGLWPQLPMSCANLRNADLSGANLYGANLRNADLSGANLQRA
jgi:hypothetical protein